VKHFNFQLHAPAANTNLRVTMDSVSMKDNVVMVDETATMDLMKMDAVRQFELLIASSNAGNILWSFNADRSLTCRELNPAEYELRIALIIVRKKWVQVDRLIRNIIIIS
jgi:hypothetical protein